MKKIIILFYLAVFFVVSFGNIAFGASEKEDTALNLELKDFYESFQIFPKTSDFESEFTRGEMAFVLKNILSYNGEVLLQSEKHISDIAKSEYKESIQAVFELGIMKGYLENSKIVFKPDDAISKIDSIKVLIDMLGYSPVAEAKGGYPYGYMIIAQNLGLYRESISFENSSLAFAMDLVYKALHIKVPAYSISVDQFQINNQGSQTYMEKYWKVLTSKGVLESNSIMPINNSNILYDNTVKINDTIYKSNLIFENNAYLWQYVKFYVDNRNDEQDEIICMYPIRSVNTKLNFTSQEDIKFNSSLQLAKNYQDRERLYKISNNARVYFNFEFLGFADNVDLTTYNSFLDKLKASDVTMVDNDGDNLSDFVWIKVYENIVVKDFLYADFRITDKYKGKIEAKEAFLKNNIFLEDNDGELFNLTDLKKDVVLSIVKNTLSSGEVKAILGYASIATVSGEIKEITDGEFVINGEEYGVSYEYINQLALKNSDVKKLEIGFNTTFNINKFNMISGINLLDISEEIPQITAFLTKISKKKGLDTGVLGIFYQVDGAFSTLELSDRLLLNGEKVKNNNVFEEIKKYAQIYDNRGVVVYRVVKYKLNNGIISELDIYAYKPKEISTELIRDDELYPGKFMESIENSMYTVYKAETIGKQVGLENSTIIFAAPSINSGSLNVFEIDDEAVYPIKLSDLDADSVFGDPSMVATNYTSGDKDNKLQMAFYDLDTTKFANIAVRYYPYSSDSDAIVDNPDLLSDCVVVEKIGRAVNKYDEVVLAIYGMSKGQPITILTKPLKYTDDIWRNFPALKYSLKKSDGSSFQASEVKVGDSIQVAYNSKGEAINFLVNVRAGNKNEEAWLTTDITPTGMSKLKAGQGNDYLGINYGSIKEYVDGKVILSELDQRERIYSLLNVTLTIFNRQTKKVYIGALSDLELDKDLYIRQYYSGIKELVYYK